MKERIGHFVKGGSWLILLGAGLFVLSFFFTFDQEKEGYYNTISNNVKKVTTSTDMALQFFDEAKEYDFYWYQIENNYLVDWNEHSSGVQLKELQKVKDENWKFHQFKSGVYLAKRIEDKVCLIFCSRRYKVSSSYLFNQLNNKIFPSWVKGISLKKKLDNDELLSCEYGDVYLHAKETKSITFNTILYVLGSLCVFVGLFWLRFYHGKKFRLTFLLFGFSVLLFVLYKVFKLPYGVVDIALFSSSYFAFSGFLASLGDVLYVSFVIFLGLWLFSKDLILKNQVIVTRWVRNKFLSKPTIFILSVIGYAVFLLFLASIYMVHQNTTLLLDITYELDFMSVKFFYYILFLMFCSIFLFVHLLLARCLLAYSFKQVFFVHLFVGFVFIILSFYFYSLVGGIAIVSYFLISLLTYNQAGKLDKVLGYELHGVLLLWVLLLSGLVASVIYEESISRKEIVANEKASELVSQEDDETKYFMTQVREQIKEDVSAINYMRVPGIGLKRLVKERIKKAYLHRYFGAYDIDIMLFDHYGEEIFHKKPYKWWQKNYLRNEYERSEGIYFIKDALGSKDAKYFIEGDFSVQGNVFGRYVIRLTKQDFSSKGIVPELLKSNKIEFSDFEKIHYCIVRDGEVKYTIGKLDYNKETEAMFNASSDGYLYHEGGVIHSIRKENNDSGVIVSVEQNTFKIWVDNFALHLIILVTIFFGGILIYTIYRVLSGNSIGILSKVQLYLYISFLVPLVLVSVISLSITRVNYEKKIRSDFEQKVKYLTDVVKSVVTKNPSLLENELQKIADYSQTDMSVFDMKGKLRYTTQPLLYNNYMLSKWINSSAYEEIVYNKQKAVFKSEQINIFDYKSMYVAIQNKISGDPLCIVHFPLFYSQTLLTKSKTIQFTTVLEIFVIVFFIIVILSILTYRTIMTPILFVAEKLNKTSFSENEEPLKWDNDDEIGAIVMGYNSMLGRISDSKRQLEQTQKEKAWRQMAQQVAHEIKNPLTPMKLKLQMMLYKLTGKDESTQKISTDISSILEHVNTVSDIATSFSSFAKMPAPKEEIINLKPIIEQEISLFTEQEVKIISNYQESDVLVKTDAKMMGRIISNIFLNAIQAYDDQTVKQIEVTYSKENDNVILSIQDYGKGIPDEIASKVFLPSFTTKPSGSGIGLDIAKRGIEFSGGRIWFESEEGTGTTFFIQLPIVL